MGACVVVGVCVSVDESLTASCLFVAVDVVVDADDVVVSTLLFCCKVCFFGASAFLLVMMFGKGRRLGSFG